MSPKGVTRAGPGERPGGRVARWPHAVIAADAAAAAALLLVVVVVVLVVVLVVLVMVAAVVMVGVVAAAAAEAAVLLLRDDACSGDREQDRRARRECTPKPRTSRQLTFCVSAAPRVRVVELDR